MYASDDRAGRPWAMYRPLARSGDFVKDKRGDFWYVIAVTEDFSQVGWECLRVQLQQVAPELNIVKSE